MTTALLANFTPTSMMLVMLILLLMFGAKKLPELARGLGQAIKEFSKAKNDIQDEILRDPAPTTQVQPPQQIPAQVVPQQAPGTYAQTAPVQQAAPAQPAAPAAPVDPARPV